MGGEAAVEGRGSCKEERAITDTDGASKSTERLGGFGGCGHRTTGIGGKAKTNVRYDKTQEEHKQ